MKLARESLKYLSFVLVGAIPPVVMWRSLIWNVSFPYRMSPIFGMALIWFVLAYLCYRSSRRVATKNITASAAQTMQMKAAPTPDMKAPTDAVPSVIRANQIVSPAKAALSTYPNTRIYGCSLSKISSIFVHILLNGAYHPVKWLSTKWKRHHELVRACPKLVIML
jgi:ABC-type phosphate/phosphonate transport system permease subunit